MSDLFNQSMSNQQVSISGTSLLPPWASESISILRLIIGDFELPYKYQDDRLMKLLLASAQLMQTELRFPQSYTIDVNTLSLIPDPVLSATRDDGFINLMVLKAACLLAGSTIVSGANQSIDIQSNKDRINLTKKLDGVIATIKNFCDAYNTAKWQYQNSIGVAGQAIIGPYRIFRDGIWPDSCFTNRSFRGIY